jgi:hypothetical protein
MSIKNNYTSSNRTTILQVREGEDEAAVAAAKASAELQAKIDAEIAKATAGLKAKNEELLGKNKNLSESIKKFDGLDFEKVKEIQARLDADEDTKLISEGKKNEVIDKYTQRMRAQHLQELKAKDDAIKAEAARADAYKGSVLDNQILKVTKDLHKGAVEDALLHARNIFTLDAKGNAVQLDSDGRPVLGKDGQTPFTPGEWIELQKELKPHWFPMSTSGSGGASGSRDASGSGKGMKRADFERLPASEQAKIARSGVKLTD